jgi:phosphohistidine phosphatase
VGFDEPFGMQRSLRGAKVGSVTRRRRLLVLRHAKAEPFAATDDARRLTDRGLQSARDVGRHLRESDLVPDFALVSTAIRTRETWAAVAGAAGADEALATFDDALFTGGPDVVLEALQAAPEQATTVLFVGHNPTAAYLCHLLDDGEGDPSAVSDLLHGFPPSALAVLDVGVPWSQLAPETSRLVGSYVGRG